MTIPFIDSLKDDMEGVSIESGLDLDDYDEEESLHLELDTVACNGIVDSLLEGKDESHEQD